MLDLYDKPEYYEIAFSYRNISAEVDTIEESIRRYSRIPVRTVLELGCGSSPHLGELAARGYKYVGVDLNESMLRYSRERARDAGLDATFVCADMAEFSLPQTVDYAFVALGSLYVASSAKLSAHFDSLSGALKTGGVYLLDWCVQFSPLDASASSWVCEKNGIHVKTCVAYRIINATEQLFEEKIMLDVDDNGKSIVLTNTAIKRAIYPQEFLLYVQSRGDFEFLGWWNDWNLDHPLGGTEVINRPIALVRKR